MKKDNMVNKKYIYFGLSILGVLLLVVTFNLLKKQTYSVETDAIIINCPEKFSVDKTIECSIDANVSYNILSVNANYSYGDQLSFVSFTTDSTCTENCFEEYANTDEGFALVLSSLIPKKGNINIGKVKFQLKDGYSVNSKQNIGLTDIEVTNETDEIVAFSNSTDNALTLNNDASLESLEILTKKTNTSVLCPLNEKFDPNVYEYTSNVENDVSSIEINAGKKDENATLSGDIDKSLDLQYGSNKFSISSVSEDKSVTKTYNITIKRTYDFSSEVYKYSKTDNYIYVGTDSNEVIISNLEELPDNNLSYEIENDKLNILYNKEILNSIDIVRIKSDYLLSSEKFYINDNLKFEDFLKKVISNNTNLTMQLVDSTSKDKVNSTSIIIENYILDVYYKTDKIVSYGFKLEYINFDDSLIVDDTKKVITRLQNGLKYEDLISKIKTSGTFIILSSKDEVLENTAIVRTGDKIKIKLSDSEIVYKISVLGDLNLIGDGIINISDISVLYRYYKGRIKSLNDENILAGDIIFDGNIDLGDVGRLYRYYKGRIDILEVEKND